MESIEDDWEALEVGRGLEAVLADPYEPDGLVVRLLGGPAAKAGQDRRVAELPHGWKLTYWPLPGGVPPIGGPISLFKAFCNWSRSSVHY